MEQQKNLQKYFTFQPNFYILSTLPMWTGWERSSFCKYKLYTFQILTASKMPNFHLNKMCESLIYLLAEKHHLFLQTKHNKLSGNFKRISDNFGGKQIFVLRHGSQLDTIRINFLVTESTLSIVTLFFILNNPEIQILTIGNRLPAHPGFCTIGSQRKVLCIFKIQEPDI